MRVSIIGLLGVGLVDGSVKPEVHAPDAYGCYSVRWFANKGFGISHYLNVCPEHPVTVMRPKTWPGDISLQGASGRDPGSVFKYLGQHLGDIFPTRVFESAIEFRKQHPEIVSGVKLNALEVKPSELHIGNEFFDSKMIKAMFDCVQKGSNLVFARYRYITEVKITKGELLEMTNAERDVATQKAQAYCDYVWIYLRDAITYLQGMTDPLVGPSN